MSQLTFNFPTEDITDIIDSENSGLSAEQRLKEIKTIINDDEMSCSSHDIEEEYIFQFRGKRYECISETRDFDIIQFNFAIEDKQWTTIKNRIVNQLKWGPNIRVVK